jgi:regulator of sirC expression with transglutaminase-like and TPR domain
MSDPQPPREQSHELLRRMLEQPDEQISLARAALLIAASEYPALDPAKYIDRLDRMAANLGGRIATETNPYDTIARINRYLYDQEGFIGNSEDYYDPRNSFLNEVLDRKTGIPITLSTVYLEIAERVGLPLVGVGMPGHFLVKHPFFDILIDPFSKGRILSEEECRDRVTQLLGEQVPFHKAFLQAVSKRHILSRMLNNLHAIYVNARQYRKALEATELSLVITPDSPPELRQRAALHIHFRKHSQAMADLARYLELEPKAEDAHTIRKTISELRRTLAHLN